MIKVRKFGLIVNSVDDVIQDENNQLDCSNLTELNDDDNLNALNEWILVDWCEDNYNLFNKYDNNGKRLSQSSFSHSEWFEKCSLSI